MKKNILLGVLCIGWFINTYAQLDPSFGIKGIVKTDMGSEFNYTNFGKEVLVQSDGSMYLIIEGNGLTSIEKKHVDGSADASYGNNGSSVSVPVYDAHATIQTDGKIVMAGYTLHSSQYYNSKDFIVARFNKDGLLDNSFNGAGIQITDFDFEDVANCLAIQSDGKIVVAGYSNNFVDVRGTDLAIARYNVDGSLDNTFSDYGTVKIDFGNSKDYAMSIAIQVDNKILAGGSALFRFNSNGAIDSNFNGSGFRYTEFGETNSIALQKDGKILAAGTLADNFIAARYNTDGSLDKTFDSDGTQTTDFGLADAVTSLVIQGDNKIVIAGYASNANNNDFAIARYNVNGTLDNTFNGNGKQITDFGSSNDHINSIAVQSDGKLVALGFTVSGLNTNIAAARYNSNGSADNSFSDNGILTDRLTQGNTYYTCTAIQSDGKIIAAGYSWNGSDYDFAIVRYNTNGSLDNSFSDDGKQMTDFGSSVDKVRAVAIQSNGKILVAGSSADNFGIARYNTDGSLDNTFDNDGIKTADFGSSDSASSIAIQSDGKILVGGTVLVRYNINGSPDLTFNESGHTTMPFNTPGSFNCNKVVIQNDGKILITTDSKYFLNITRYNTDGSVDNTFGNFSGVDGTSQIYSGDQGDLHGKSMALQSDGKIVVGGDYEDSYRGMYSQFFLTRLNADGSLDNTFDEDGMAFTLPGSNRLDYGTSLVIESDNKIIMGGYSYNGSSDDFAIIRYNTNGSLDPTFNGNGILITPCSAAYDKIAGIAIADDALYATGFGQYPGNFGVVAKYLLATGGPLPVALTDFTAVLQNNLVLLQWQTATEKNLSDFIIERSKDGATFLPIEKVAATGNSSAKTNYSTADQQPLQGVSFYRLKLVDQDHKFTYSKIVAINAGNPTFALQISPNPAKDILLVHADGENEKATLQIIDASGRILKDVKVILNGNTSISFNIIDLPKGMYYLRLHTKAKIETRKFIKE